MRVTEPICAPRDCVSWHYRPPGSRSNYVFHYLKEHLTNFLWQQTRGFRPVPNLWTKCVQKRVTKCDQKRLLQELRHFIAATLCSHWALFAYFGKCAKTTHFLEKHAQNRSKYTHARSFFQMRGTWAWPPWCTNWL